ncbi:MAG: polyprenyl synthetase family protein [Acidimicrobiia bacterium]|nr:polyprenyl synthetase family protein [Acidimicrobiia bacterium]MYC57970.1 polyprenyl synthetase family protein [Acidimicrobiia bacterium]MYG94658.1 polyprenyl synthetase family protein [Acidimicrobiia bacterium]MYI31081.1 polyprenyl synthetase family protein [Acidimicrobiia bacterium]
MSSAEEATAILERAKALVGPAIFEVLRRLNPELSMSAIYHCEGKGKGARPALALLSAEAAGATSHVGLPGAVAIELIHDFSLIHDDIIDADTERRHRPTVWAKFGVGTGVITGDALHALAYETLLSDPTPARVRAAGELTRAVSAMIAGQSMDMAFEHLPTITVEQCLAMERGKTGALLSFACSVGAILADADEGFISALADFGMHLGIAFQATDDLLGIWGDPARTGKPAGSDLRVCKKSMPVVIALNNSSSVAVELAKIYGCQDEGRFISDGLAQTDLAQMDLVAAQPVLDDAAVNKAQVLVEAGGGREQTQALARQHFEEAVTALDSIAQTNTVNAQAIQEMRCLAEFIVGRDF